MTDAESISKIIEKWDQERGGIGFACFSTEYERQEAFRKADWEALTSIKAALALTRPHRGGDE